MKKHRKMIAYCLSVIMVLLVFTNGQFETVEAEVISESSEKQFVNNAETEEFSVPDIICEDEAQKYTGRLKDEEKDLYTLVFSNGDGTNTIRIFSHPVKYIDKDRITKDISLKLQK